MWIILKTCFRSVLPTISVERDSLFLSDCSIAPDSVPLGLPHVICSTELGRESTHPTQALSNGHTEQCFLEQKKEGVLGSKYTLKLSLTQALLRYQRDPFLPIESHPSSDKILPPFPIAYMIQIRIT